MAKQHYSIRSEAKLKRRELKNRLYDRMLIVCEGAKTEVNYFQAIRREKRIPSADIKIIHSSTGTEPLQIVDCAEETFKKNKSFDCIFVVFDRDSHLTYKNALSKAKALDKKLTNDQGKKVRFYAVPSVPNFEFWLLLHFQNVSAFMTREKVYAELKKPACYPTYEKNSLTVFLDTKARTALAVQRAKSLRELYNAHSGTDPYTDADILTGKMLALEDRLK